MNAGSKPRALDGFQIVAIQKIDVEKSSYRQLSQTEIGGDNPCGC
jgi:hypothetical protein